jgi:hypothetical protein
MSDDERKPRIHIHTGGLIIFIIIILILFKVDIFSKITSPQFQKNVTYIKTSANDLYIKYILNPFKIKANDLFINATNKEVQKIQNNFTNNVLKPVTEKDIENASN